MMERRVGVDLGLRSKHRAVVYDGSVRRGRAFGVEVSREGFDELLRTFTPMNFQTSARRSFFYVFILFI